jgi:hypothetical protein
LTKIYKTKTPERRLTQKTTDSTCKNAGSEFGQNIKIKNEIDGDGKGKSNLFDAVTSHTSSIHQLS